MADGARTHDNRNHNPGLYQLSYSHRRGWQYTRGLRRYRPSSGLQAGLRQEAAPYFAAVCDPLEASAAGCFAGSILTLKRAFNAS